MKRRIGFVFLGLLVGGADLAQAQSGAAFGIGPRVTFQRGDDAEPDSSSLRVFGGQIRLRLSPGAAIEVAADYDSTLNQSLSQRVKSMPIQASLLLYPIRSTISPYVLGGIGWYRHSVTDTTTTPTTEATTSIRETGYHAGLGAELRVGRRMAIHGDYRYNHIRFGGSDSSTTQQPASGIPGLSAIQRSLKLSNGGSMWNWNVLFLKVGSWKFAGWQFGWHFQFQ